jgi:uncharacterized membrane protein YeaQ/YmgE (transglycosylase-associated protein family)
MGDCLVLIGVLILAAVAGWFADLVIPGKMPYGWIGGVAAGIIGGLIAGFLLPFDIGGLHSCSGSFCYYLIPGIIGAIIFAFLIRFLMGMNRNRV